MKRVYCLYRVSTTKQLEENNIPMQRAACREFAQRKGWTITEEFEEKGVSGFKKSVDERVVMQQIKKEAILAKFDILLVFMFDRLGRRDDETPFVVEWFVKNGIEVWSVTEGEQRFDDHLDKLFNYLRYWQSSGESIKTSIRTKTRLEQLTMEGRYTGGKIPYGYKICKMGRFNKRNHEVHELQIDPEKAEIVRCIFAKYLEGTMGTYAIARWLTEQSIPKGDQNHWHSSSINNMLKNTAYVGILKCGNVHSDNIEYLRIIDNVTFEKVQEIIKENRIRHNNKNLSFLKIQVLCADLVYCGHCGQKLTLTTSNKKYERKDGTVTNTKRIKYKCPSKSQHHVCDGKTIYSAAMLDALITKTIISTFQPSVDGTKKKNIRQNLCDTAEKIKTQILQLQNELVEEEHTFLNMKDEAVNVIRGKSSFSPVLVSQLIEKCEKNISMLKENLRQQNSELQIQLNSIQIFDADNNALEKIALGISKLTTNEKQEIIHRYIRKISVKKDWEIDIDWQFQ